MSVVIRPEVNQDRAAIWNVYQAAFEGGAEANLIDALHEGGCDEVSLVVEMDGEIVGHVLCVSASLREAFRFPAAVTGKNVTKERHRIC